MERRTKRATPRRPLHRNRQTLSPIWRANKISLCNPSLEIDADQIGWPCANARAHGAPWRGWLLGSFISRLYRPVAVTPPDIDVTILNGTPSFSFPVLLHFFRYHSPVSLLTRFSSNSLKIYSEILVAFRATTQVRSSSVKSKGKRWYRSKLFQRRYLPAAFRRLLTDE